MYSDTTTTSSALDFSFYFIFWCSVALLVAITGTMIFFVVRFRKSRHPQAENIEGNVWLEIFWTAIPTLLVLVMFYFGWSGYEVARRVPENAMTIRVTAQMWSWLFEYPNGKTDVELRVPLDKPIKLVLVSRDVNHSFYVAAFRIKEDIIPGRENYLWFQAKHVDTYDIQCAEFCGTRHSGMLAKLHVLAQEEFNRWYNTPIPDDALAGDKLLRLKGCLSCHSLDGTPGVGPSFKGIYGKTESFSVRGGEALVSIDEEYLEESILQPNAKIVRGYRAGVMPAQEGRISDEELKAIISYLSQLR